MPQSEEKRLYAISIAATRINKGDQQVGCASVLIHTTESNAYFVGDKKAYLEFPKADGWVGHSIVVTSFPLKIYEGVSGT